MIIINRIYQFIKYKEVSIRQFEKKINVSNGLISNAKRKKTDIQSKWVSEILYNFPEINADWLMTGKGEMLKHSIANVGNINNGNNNIRGNNNKVGNNVGDNNININKEKKDSTIKELSVENKYLKLENENLKNLIKSKERIIELLEKTQK